MTAKIRQLTKGPAFRWFGYYDKLEFVVDSAHEGNRQLFLIDIRGIVG